MTLRPASVIILGGALLAACAATYLWGLLAALLAAACGAAGFAAARLAGQRPPKRTPEGLADAFPLREVERSEVPAPTVATAVAAGEVPAGALLEATMDSMREGVLVIDSAMRVVASNPSARDIFGTGGEAALRRRR